MIEVMVQKTFTENQRNAEKCFDALRNIEGASQSGATLIGCSKSTCIVVYFKGDERQMLSKIRRVLLKYNDSSETAL